jgi:Sporulation and spore germination
VSRVRIAMLGTALALALALGACGVPISGSPRAISRNQVPTPPPPSTTTTAGADEIPVTIVLVNATTSLAAVATRYAPQQSDHLSTALSDLLAWTPTGNEQGLTSAIPAATRLVGVSPNANLGETPTTVVTVNLSLDFLAINGLSQVLAVEQVVFTVACALVPTTRVLFEVDGVAQPVPIGSGISVSRPVSATDYPSPPACAS